MQCPKCSGAAVFPEGLRGEKVCTKCGLVIERNSGARHFSPWSPEWPSNYDEADSATLKEWLTSLRLASCQLNIPSFPYREEAARVIRKEQRLFFQRQRFAKNKKATVAALMHLILREYGKERSIKEISQQLQLDSKLVMRQTWTLNKEIKTKKQLLRTHRKSSKDYIYEYGGKITCNSQLLNAARETLAKIPKKGGNPLAVSAGAFYYACKSEKARITKKVIGNIFGVSDRTVDMSERIIRRHITAAMATN
jgi:transcription initiation factor TFIIIB Brf1 subunit/transcription initiation factor TFIIB